MTGKDFDKEISELYQQRKAQVVAPTIDLQQQPLVSNYHPTKLLSLFVAGGIASFGVMAIISHLSTPPSEVTITKVTEQPIKLIDLPPQEADEKQVLVAKSLPTKPESNLAKLAHGTELQVTQNNEQSMSEVINVEALITPVSLPTLTAPKVTLEPTYKVLPEYSLSARKAQQTGEVVLRYQIDSAGKVTNITLISSDVSRELQRSAKKALTQWRYKPSNSLPGEQVVTFQFTIEEKG